MLDRKELACRFNDFFAKTIMYIPEELTSITITTPQPHKVCSDEDNIVQTSVTNDKPHGFFLLNLNLYLMLKIRKLIFSTKNKHCSQEPMPTRLLKDCTEAVLAPISLLIVKSTIIAFVEAAHFSLSGSHIISFGQ